MAPSLIYQVTYAPAVFCAYSLFVVSLVCINMSSHKFLKKMCFFRLKLSLTPEEILNVSREKLKDILSGTPVVSNTRFVNLI